MRRSPQSLHNIQRQLAFGTAALFILLGAWLRFSHLDWDDWQQLHPDERGIWYVAQTIELPHTPSEILPPQHSPLNPYRTTSGDRRTYPYGHLPLYLTVFISNILHAINGEDQPVALLHASRIVSATSDTLTILIAALLAYELGGQWAGATAAGMMAFAVIHIQDAHFGTVDTMAAMFATATIWLLVRLVRTHSRRDALLALTHERGLAMPIAR